MISPVEEEKDSIGIFQDTTVSEVKEASMLSEKDKKTEAAMARQPEKMMPVVVDEPRKQPDIKQVPAEGNKITIQPVQPTAEEIEAEYVALIASGKEKMGKADFTNAKKDFTKAKETKLTEEVVRLLISCDEKEAAKLLADRKAQYEMKKTSGTLQLYERNRPCYMGRSIRMRTSVYHVNIVMSGLPKMAVLSNVKMVCSISIMLMACW